MFADAVLKLLGENPAAYLDPTDKTVVIIGKLLLVGIPLILILLFLFPFLYPWWEKSDFLFAISH